MLFGFGLLLPNAPVWQMPPNDMPQMVAGTEALFQEDWSFPPAVTDRLVAPMRISIVLTDSLPWFTLLLKALHLSPDKVAPLALFLLVAHLLQAIGMVALLRALGITRPAGLIGGVALALLMPVWISRQFGHIALSGHFILLMTLALFATAVRRGLTGWHAVGFAGLMALALGTHPYHIVPVSALVAAAFATELLCRRPGAWLRVAGGGLGCVLAVAVSYVVLGYGASSIQSSGGGFGVFSINLLGPVWPQASSLAGQRWADGWFTGTVDPTGGQSFEGYAYLGAGILCTVVMGLVVALLRKSRPEAPSSWSWRQFLPAAVVLLGLTLWAIGPKVWVLNHLVLVLPEPEGRLAEVMGIFRAHARFFWVPSYALLALGILALDRRLSQPALSAVMVVAVGLQVADTAVMRWAVGDRFTKPADLTFPPALAKSQAIAGRMWHFLPTLYCLRGVEADHDVVRQLSLVALRNGGRTNSAPTGRNPWPNCQAPFEAPRGTDDLLVLSREALLTTRAMQHASGGLPCYAMPRGALCGTGLEGIRGLVPMRWGPEGPFLPLNETTISLSSAAEIPAILRSGFSAREPWGVWSDGRVAEVAFRVPSLEHEPNLRSVAISIEGIGFVPPPLQSQTVNISANGHAVGSYEFVAGWQRIEITVPRAVIVDAPWLVLRFDIPNATLADPAMPTSRLLGLGIKELNIRPIWSDAAEDLEKAN
jgi:hypothetical protein